ncbi:MAG: SMC-Scp complex subunit ScpB [Deltaproteobacteria bacterium CG_4_10_14_0_2_um_filter_43_8]|nr:MAG: SMC-Scp complex subunit ScpB [Deltaproteobacteria bacterium CG11_big_fil_rev_8_21_14_0_20_42_23]PJA19990.1 MAG: SMC-Scp complex subunit ScpB [Deltaproteobacteria bacterium CG_4_10_14_0_2_um_filter_43_8]PJC64644.1 MAG: SMC-Scp complex subunit ScpB [Deltaproteobacteria bacterium CG_4_9_14_0_2_um_filter_42_21]
MEKQELCSLIEAYIFVSEEPLSDRRLADLLEDQGVSRDEVKEVLDELEQSYNENPARGIQFKKIAGGYQFRSKEKCADALKRLNLPKPTRLSPAALETLAIIAYQQPCIRSEIEDVRGVDSGGVIKTLLEKDLVKIVGKRDEAGQPLLYGTTKTFLELFDLSDLKALPSLSEIQEIMQKKQVLTEEGTGRQMELLSGDGDDDEEQTEVIEQGEEETEVISQLEISEEEDEEAIADLDYTLKSVRLLEKDIFTHPVVKEQFKDVKLDDEGEEKSGKQSHEEQSLSAQEEEYSVASEAESTHSHAEDESAANDETEPSDSSYH